MLVALLGKPFETSLAFVIRRRGYLAQLEIPRTNSGLMNEQVCVT